MLARMMSGRSERSSRKRMLVAAAVHMNDSCDIINKPQVQMFYDLFYDVIY